MTNIVEELGTDRFRQKFNGAFFLNEDGVPSLVSSASGGLVSATAVTGTVKSPRVNAISIPYNFFSGLAVFKTPKLGWRTSHEGKVLTYLIRDNRSYHRGTSEHNLRTNNSAMTDWLTRSGNLTLGLSASKLCLLTLAPEFMKFSEGIEAIRNGSVLSFAASPDIAVGPSEDDNLDIYFRQNVAGRVKPDNTVEVSLPIITEYLKELQ